MPVLAVSYVCFTPFLFIPTPFGASVHSQPGVGQPFRQPPKMEAVFKSVIFKKEMRTEILCPKVIENSKIP